MNFPLYLATKSVHADLPELDRPTEYEDTLYSFDPINDSFDRLDLGDGFSVTTHVICGEQPTYQLATIGVWFDAITRRVIKVRDRCHDAKECFDEARRNRHLIWFAVVKSSVKLF